MSEIILYTVVFPGDGTWESKKINNAHTVSTVKRNCIFEITNAFQYQSYN